MPAARYWRIVGVETYAGGDLELSELHLYGASGRLDAAATLTSTIAPAAGTLAALQDDNLGTTCRFAAAAVRAGGFAIAWDFGAGNTADNVGLRLGASADQSAFMAGCTLQYSTDGARWQRLAKFARYAWPGVDAYTVAPTVGDPDFDQVSLLLHMDGADGSTTFTDSSAAPKALTHTSNVQISTLRGMSEGTSAYFTGGKLTASSNEFAFGTGDFTVEFCLYRVSTQWEWAGLFAIGGIAGLSLRIVGGSNTLNFIHSSSTNFSATYAYLRVGAWDHVAVCRYSGTTSVYINGVLGGSGSHTQNHTSTSLEIGGNAGQDAGLVGYIDEFRITKGVARYTANFTPPTEAFLNSAGGSGGTLFVSRILHTAPPVRASIAASAPVPTHSTPFAHRLQLARDVEFGGSGTVYGTTKTKGTPNLPTKARVVLLHQRSKLPVREVWSDPTTGDFAFEGIDTRQEFLTLAEDAAGNFRPVAASRLVPEVAP